MVNVAGSRKVTRSHVGVLVVVLHELRPATYRLGIGGGVPCNGGD